MMKGLIILLFLLSLSGCLEDSREKSDQVAANSDTMVFEEAKWKIREGQDYPYRDEMLKDLMNNPEVLNQRGLRELKRSEIIELLGEPNRIDTNYLFYRVKQKRLGWWPIHTKTLVVHLDQNDSVNWVKIHE